MVTKAFVKTNSSNKMTQMTRDTRKESRSGDSEVLPVTPCQKRKDQINL